MNNKSLKAGIVVLLLIVVAVIHHLPIHGLLGKHILHRDLFFIPIVMAALWFGLRASLLAAVAASIFYAQFFYHNMNPGSLSIPVVGVQVAGFNLMALFTGWMVARQRRERRERDFLNETFGRYVSKEVRDEILAGRVTLSGELKEVTVLFADLRDFTALVETHPPRAVVKLINSYFSVMSEAINAHHGLVLQFIGDEIEAVFGAPVVLENHQQWAIDAALEMRKRLSRLNLELADRGFPTLRHGIGIHTGKVLAANIGSAQRLSYALVGETVNVASRIQALNKDFDTDILLSETAFQCMGECVRIDPQVLPPVCVKGIREPLTLYRI